MSTSVLSSNMSIGYYSCSWNGQDVGKVEGVRRFRRRVSHQRIESDLYGSSMIDGVYRGGDSFFLMTFKEWTPAVRSVVWPFGVDFGAVGAVGAKLSSFARSMVLTAVPGSTAYDLGPRVITAPYAILAPENDTEIVFGNEQRDIPLLFQLLPYDASGTTRWFTVTQP